jgi:hypothetical protein
MGIGASEANATFPNCPPSGFTLRTYHNAATRRRRLAGMCALTPSGLPSETETPPCVWPDCACRIFLPRPAQSASSSCLSRSMRFGRFHDREIVHYSVGVSISQCAERVGNLPSLPACAGAPTEAIVELRLKVGEQCRQIKRPLASAVLAAGVEARAVRRLVSRRKWTEMGSDSTQQFSLLGRELVVSEDAFGP